MISSSNLTADSLKRADEVTRVSRHGNKTILVPLDTYLPGFRAGGPIRSIANMVEALGDELQFRVVALDRDLGDTAPFPSTPTNQWVSVGGALVLYLKPGLHGFLRTYMVLRSLDRNTVLYLNSVFARRVSLLPMVMRYFKLCKPQCVVIAPRGGFSQGAMGIKRVRKSFYLRMMRWLGIYDSLIWHACNDFERDDILRYFPGAKPVNLAALTDENASDGINGRGAWIVTAPEISIPKASQRVRTAKKAGQLRLLFISRIARMKNLLGALEILRGVSGKITYDIYGPTEDTEYWEECQQLITALPGNIRVQYCGALEHDRVAEVLSAHDLFFLPTLGEGYGHVIYEALASGCPVLISDQTPWRDLEKEGVGWDIPLNEPDRFRRILHAFLELDEEAYLTYSRNTTRYLAKRTSDPTTINASRQLFRLAYSCGKAS